MKAHRIRRNAWVTAASCIPWALIPVFAILTLLTHLPFAALTPHLLVIGAVAFVNVWRRKPQARLEPIHVATNASSLLIDDEEIPREDIKTAAIVPWINNTIVRVGLRGRIDEDIVLDDDEAAHTLLKQLGFDPSQTTATYRTASLALTRYRWAPFMVIPLAILASMASSALHLHANGLLPLVILGFLPFLLVPGSVTVGVDGVLVKWLWMREFVAAKDIIMVKRFDKSFGRNRRRGVELTLPGRTLELPMYSDDMIATVEKRIRDALALARGTEHVEDDALLLTRGGDEGLRDWIMHLKAIGAGATATLRTAAVSPEMLWRVAEDPAQPAIKRAAAAVALSPALGEDDKVRLAEMAKATAAPKLRIALERVAEDATDEEMEEALRELGG